MVNLNFLELKISNSSPQNFREEYKLLLDQGIMNITVRDENSDDPFEKLFVQKISQIVKKMMTTYFLFTLKRQMLKL